MLPSTAPDIELHNKLVLDSNGKPKGSYAGIPFLVVSCRVYTGRDVKTVELHNGTTQGMGLEEGGRASTTATGGGKDYDKLVAKTKATQAARAAAIEAGVSPEKAKKISVDLATIDATVSYIDPGDHPLVTDKGAIPNKVVLRIAFITRKDNTITSISADRTLTPAESENLYVSYTLDRDAFIKATNDPNPAELQLPTYGKFLASPGTMTTVYQNDKGGVEYVDAVFYRATRDLSLPSAEGTVALVDTNISYLYNTVVAVVAQLQQDVLDAVSADVGITTNKLTKVAEEDNRNALEKFSDGIGTVISATVSKVDEFNRKVTAISNDISTLMLTPARLAGEIQNAFVTLTDAITAPVDAFNYMKSFVGIFLDDMESIAYDTLDTLGLYSASVSTQYASNGFSAMCQTTTDTSFTSVEEVEEVIAILTETNNRLVSSITQLPEYENVLGDIQTLYGASVAYLLEQQALLPNVRNITSRVNTPLITTAYLLYGDSSQVTLLQSRNKVQNNLVPPIELEVLTE